MMKLICITILLTSLGAFADTTYKNGSWKCYDGTSGTASSDCFSVDSIKGRADKACAGHCTASGTPTQRPLPGKLLRPSSSQQKCGVSQFNAGTACVSTQPRTPSQPAFCSTKPPVKVVAATNYPEWTEEPVVTSLEFSRSYEQSNRVHCVFKTNSKIVFSIDQFVDGVQMGDCTQHGTTLSCTYNNIKKDFSCPAPVYMKGLNAQGWAFDVRGNVQASLVQAISVSDTIRCQYSVAAGFEIDLYRP